MRFNFFMNLEKMKIFAKQTFDFYSLFSSRQRENVMDIHLNPQEIFFSVDLFLMCDAGIFLKDILLKPIDLFFH